MANDIDKTSPHFKGEFGSIYEVNRKFPSGGVEGDYVAIDGWAHYWNADRGTWCVNAQRDSYWDELITGIINKLKLFKGATYMGVAGVSTIPEKIAGAKMYYFAKAAGTYSGFGGLKFAQGINVLYTDNGTSWTATPLLEVAQELGVSTEKVMSQKAVNTELDKKANTADVDTKFTEEKNRVDGELGKKFDKESVVQESGEAEDKVMSQKVVSDKLSDLPKHAVFVLGTIKTTIAVSTKENKITIVLPKDLSIICGKIKYYLSENVEIQKDRADGNLFFVVFNTETKAFKIIRYHEGLEINDVFMFGMNVATKQVNCNPNIVTFDTLPSTGASDVYYTNQYISDKTLNKAIDNLYNKTFSYLNLYRNSKTLKLEKFIENHYVDFSGKILPYNNYDIYKPVKLLKGQAINVECISAEIAVISLSETENITEESMLTVVAKSTNYGYTQSFTYIATSDCFVVVSCKELGVAQIFNRSDECITQRGAYYKLENRISNIGGAMYLGDSLPYIQGGKLHLGSTFCLCGVYFDGTEIIVPLKSHFDQYSSSWRKMVFDPITKQFDDLDYDKTVPSGYVTLGNYVLSVYSSNEFTGTLTNFDFNFIVKSLDADGNVINPTNAELKEMIGKKGDTNSIFYWNKPEVYDNIMLQATRRLLSDKYDFKPLVLCHFSDIHGDSINLKRILEFYNNYKEYFTDIIHTGDIISDTFDDDFEFWKNTKGSNIILNCIGNHDSSRKEGGNYIQGITSKQCFDKFFKEQIENWNCVQPESAADLGLCYYYKDYSDSKIRLVVLDCMHYTDNQNSWFSQVLTEAKDKNYSVLVANHYQGGAMKCDNSCTFQSPLWTHADATINEKASATVDSFMNAGGDFIAWICGHSHRDLFGVLEKYPNQTCIAVDCGLCTDYWNDSFRRRGTKSQDCFNIMSINRSLNTFSIYRVGNNIDLQLRSKKCLVYNYATHKVISNY